MYKTSFIQKPLTGLIAIGTAITLVMATATFSLAANAEGNTANVTVTATTPYIVNISDYSADFTVSDYKTPDTGNGAETWSIWTNAPGTITVTVATNQSDGSHAYMQNTAYTAADGQNKIPFEILYQPCGDFGAPIDMTPRNGQAQFQLSSANANQQTCNQNPGVIMVRRPAMEDMGPPLAGTYASTVTVTVQEPAGVSGGQVISP